MSGKHYKWMVNLTIAITILLAFLADKYPEYKTLMLCFAGFVVGSTTVLSFKRNFRELDKNKS